jgi:hypothetical protein
MMQITLEVQTYCALLTDDQQVIFDRLAAIAHTVDPAIQNAVKWSVPTFTLEGNWHHWLFSLAETQKGIKLTFHMGWLLSDPTHALQGNGKHLRHILFNDMAQIKESVVAELMREAIHHQLES